MSNLDATARSIPFRPKRRRLPWFLAGAVAVGAMGLAGVLVASLALPNLFGTTTHEQPNAVVLAQIDDLSEYQAATGRFQTIVDVDEDANLLPDWVKGEHKVLAAEGDVAASVDFSRLDENAITVSDDGRSVTVHVPSPTLDDAQLDRSSTRVIARDRGVLDRLDDALTSGNPSDDDALYTRAADKLGEAAAQSDLQDRAEANTRDFLAGLFQDAGYANVTVVFDPPPDPSVSF